jgi:hypothetical protein
MLLVMWAVAPVGWMSQYVNPQARQRARNNGLIKIVGDVSTDRGSAPYRDAQPTSASTSLPCVWAQGASTHQVILNTGGETPKHR